MMDDEEDEVYDVAVVGGGVVGCAIVYRLARAGYRCIVLEKEPHLISGASSGNSAQAHTKLNADLCTVEGECLQSAADVLDVCKDHNVPHKVIGAIMVAFNQSELEATETILQKSKGQMSRVSREEIQRLEPHISGNVISGLLVPGEGVIDSWMYGITMAHAAKRIGAKIMCDSEVTNVSQRADTSWLLTLAGGGGGRFRARTVINAAGLYGDKVETLKGQEPKFRIRPRKGQYAVFDKHEPLLLHHIVLPVPTVITRGVLIFPTVYGNIVVGPTAEECLERQHPSIDESVSQDLVKYARRVIPALADIPVLGSYAGLRPGTNDKDYHIHSDRNWITVGGIRSTGVSASQGIAKYVHRLLVDDIKLHPSARPRLDPGTVQPMPTKDNSVVLDGAEYNVTHPISRFGIWHEHSTTSKL